MAGYPQTRADIDDRSGALAVGLRNLFEQIDAFGSYLDGTPDNTLQTPPQSYTNAEVAQLKSAFNDLRRLGRIYRGEEAGGDAYDFRSFARLLTGVL